MTVPPSPPPPSDDVSGQTGKPERRRCSGMTPRGPCANAPRIGAATCRFHSDDPSDRQTVAEMGRKGGERKAFAALKSSPPVCDVLDMRALDLTTVPGCVALLAATARQLTLLPLDTRVATAIVQCVGGLRPAIELNDLQERIAALELSLNDRHRPARVALVDGA